MSLYHEASQILQKAHTQGGSLKSHIFTNSSSRREPNEETNGDSIDNRKKPKANPSSSKATGFIPPHSNTPQPHPQQKFKSDPKTLYALTTETTKWSSILSPIISSSGLLAAEKKSLSSSYLALVLTYDLLLSKKGIALPATHGLYTAMHRHRARLSAELIKARLKLGCASLEGLRIEVERLWEGKGRGGRYPRWVRVNSLKGGVEEFLGEMDGEWERVGSVGEVLGDGGRKRVFVDEHVPRLLAFPPGVELTGTKAYKEGRIILQDKASCFPAYLLDPKAGDGDVIDACAAPGNKTTHLAAILGQGTDSRVVACEKDPVRSLTLSKMVKIAGAQGIVDVKEKQDFMKLNPESKEFANVTALLLDPSCSGSGIVGRDEEQIELHLPTTLEMQALGKNKKRKREAEHGAKKEVKEADPNEEEAPLEIDDKEKLQTRLTALSSFQLRLLERAMSFPAAKRITYSTCSVHKEENEDVVVKALLSDVARERGWKIMERDEQVDGMKRWHVRGWKDACEELVGSSGIDAQTVAEACIRCEKGSEDGTMGFFVAGFVRGDAPSARTNGHHHDEAEDTDESEWNGFED